MLIIDKYAYQNRWVAVSPSYKWWAYLAVLVTAMMTPIAWQFALFILLSVVTCYAGRLTSKQYLQWLSLPFGFLAMSLIAMLVTYSDNSAHLIASLPMFDGYVGVSAQTVDTAMTTFFRCLCSIAATLCFVIITPFNQCVTLLKKARLPSVLVEQVLLTYRFIFIFIEETHAIYTAQTLRFGYIKRGLWLKSLAMLVGVLLQRVMIRHHHMQSALAVKLYQGEFHQ
ncbi:cobalt ECF transporter T component CbiQ [Vibrio ziniensis]|uniref:Cobalt ECF transporter T component CbiQ n=1 Tax=Vibrio ziniensis TaxID=2711221 RepID=A0A6G7CII2_9VIBR|nr:cobalt ECF transporter T component CbiQ [Vibrio ziniensis]QIH41856.1 cobalt ECF transporter T component CbiQ [Vibrio ziniensis]